MAAHEKVIEGVFMVTGEGLTSSSDCQSYALDLGVPILIDCGCGPDWSPVRENMLSAGLEPETLDTLILTHCHVDHIGAAPSVISATSCKVVAHKADKVAIQTGDPKKTAANWYNMTLEPLVVDQVLEAKQETLSFPKAELHLLHTPGHTPGSIVAWMDSDEGRILFGQDIHGPFAPAFGSDKHAWRKSMQKLIELKADILCEGHFGIYRGQDEVRSFIESHLARH